MQGGGDGPGRATRPDDGNAVVVPTHFSEGVAESFDIGVPAFQSRALPADGVDRADAGCQRIQVIEEGEHRFLVRDRDVGAEDAFIDAQVGHRRGELGSADLAKQVLAINAECREGGVLHHGREAPGNGGAQQQHSIHG